MMKLAKIKLAKAEQSTQTYHNGASDKAEVYSEEPATIRQLKRLAQEYGLSEHETCCVAMESLSLRTGSKLSHRSCCQKLS
jgi:hypothetical protein